MIKCSTFCDDFEINSCGSDELLIDSSFLNYDFDIMERDGSIVIRITRVTPMYEYIYIYD